jgi:septal ring factor EnvC (AmiA/AmiB activator)
MFAKFKIWITQLSAVAKIVTVLISFIVGVAGGVIAYNKYIIKHYEQEQAVIQQTEEFKAMQSNFKIVIDSIGELSKEVRLIKPEIDKANKKIDNLDRSYTQHLKNDNRVDELIQYLESEKKNSGISMIPSKQNTYSTQ